MRQIRTNKQWRLLLSLLAVVALFAASCGSDDSESSDSASGTTEETDSSGSDDAESGSDDAESGSDDAESGSDDAESGSDAEEVDVTQSGTAGAAGPRHVCAIGGADSFFAVLKNGADLAGEAVLQAGNEYTWISLPDYNNIGPDMVRLIEQAVAQDCTSLAVPVWDGAAQAPALQTAIDEGVHVFMYNSGLPLLEDGTIEALGYYGTDEYLAGVRAGEYFAESGAQNVRCVNTQPGAVNWQQRCGGLVDGATGAGIDAAEIILPAEAFGDAAAISAAVQAELVEDPSIDGFATGAAADSDAVSSALDAVGGTAMQGGWDVSENIINRIKDGEALFAVDQQGWYQGWLAVSQAWMYDQYSILPANPVILTGPALITADNADSVLAGVVDGYR